MQAAGARCRRGVHLRWAFRRPLCIPGYVLLNLGLNGARPCRASITPSPILWPGVCCRVGTPTRGPHKHYSSSPSWSTVISAEHRDHHTQDMPKCRENYLSAMLLPAVLNMHWSLGQEAYISLCTGKDKAKQEEIRRESSREGLLVEGADL